MTNPYYTKTFDVTPGSTVGSQRIEDQYLLVEQGFDAVNVQMLLRGSIAGQAWTGAHTFPTQSAGDNSTLVATTAFVTTSFAPKANPTFTGTVTVPTPTNSTDAANKAYADGLVFSSTLPGVDLPANAGKYITTNGTIAGWSDPLANAALTGVPTTPTAAVNTSTTQVASTAFVVTQISVAAPAPGAGNFGYLNIPQNSQSAPYTAVLDDAGKHILHPSADTTARTFTIPANSSVAYPIGTALTFINQNGAGTVTIAINTDTMRLAGAGTTGSRTLAANGVATAVKVTTTEWLISGTNLT